MNRKHKITASTVILIFLASSSFACQAAPLASPQVAETPAAAVPTEPAAAETATAIPVASPTLDEAPVLKLVTLVRDETRDDPPAVFFRRIPQLEGSPELTTAFNALAKEKVDAEETIFRDGLKDWTSFPDMPDAPHSFLSGYSVYSANRVLISLKLEFSTYVTGAAHPYSFVRTLNYDLSSGSELSLKEIFKPGVDYLAVLSEFCKKDLTGKLGDMLFSEGFAPMEENFRSWGLVPEGLVIEFDPYQVAAYAVGPQTVLVPFDSLKDILAQDKLDGWMNAAEINVAADDVPPLWPTPKPTQ